MLSRRGLVGSVSAKWAELTTSHRAPYSRLKASGGGSYLAGRPSSARPFAVGSQSDVHDPNVNSSGSYSYRSPGIQSFRAKLQLWTDKPAATAVEPLNLGMAVTDRGGGQTLGPPADPPPSSTSPKPKPAQEPTKPPQPARPAALPAASSAAAEARERRASRASRTSLAEPKSQGLGAASPSVADPDDFTA